MIDFRIYNAQRVRLKRKLELQSISISPYGEIGKRKMTEAEIAWCAGLFEGEGSLFIANQFRNYKYYQYIRITIKMTDLDILERFKNTVSCGQIIHQTEKGKAKLPEHYKKHYYWQLNKEDKIKELMTLFWPHLGIRRRAKIIEVFGELA